MLYALSSTEADYIAVSSPGDKTRILFFVE